MPIHIDYLKKISANPADESIRNEYLQFLKESGDPHLPYFEITFDIERLSYIEWLISKGNLDYYLANKPEIAALHTQWLDNEPKRSELKRMAPHLDIDWIAFFNTLANPFKPFYFFNNHGNINEIDESEMPFRSALGSRGYLLTFEDSFTQESSFDTSLVKDILFLQGLQLDDCAYGAATCPVHRFMCEVSPDGNQNYQLDDFRSIFHIESDCDIRLNQDFYEQAIFPVEIETWDGDELELDEMSGTHGEIKTYVQDSQLWNLEIFAKPKNSSDTSISRYKIHITCGLSPNGKRVIGVISHNLA